MHRYLIVLIFILSHRLFAAEAFSSATSVTVSAGKGGLWKTLQGQAPFFAPPNSFPYEKIPGLKETISHHWDRDDSSLRSLFPSIPMQM